MKSLLRILGSSAVFVLINHIFLHNPLLAACVVGLVIGIVGVAVDRVFKSDAKIEESIQKMDELEAILKKKNG